MKLSKVLQCMEQQIHAISRWFSLLGMVMVLVMMSITAVYVLLRYFFRRPWKGSVDVQELMLVIVVFSSLAYMQFLKQHINTTVITSRLSKHTQAVLEVFKSLLGVGIFGFMGWGTITYAWRMLLGQDPTYTLTLEIPNAPFILIAGVGLSLLCLEQLISFFHSVHELKVNT